MTTRVRQLQDDLGVALFVREGKRLYPSPAGRVLNGYADWLLALADEARAAVAGPEPQGVFRLGAMESTAAVRLSGPLATYAKRHPVVTLDLPTGNPGQLVAAAKFYVITAFEEETVIVTPGGHPPIAAPSGVPKTMIVFEQGCPYRRRLEEWYAGRDDAPARVVELSSYHAMLGCVLDGMGAALLPKSVLKTFPESRQLKVHALPKGKQILKALLV